LAPPLESGSSKALMQSFPSGVFERGYRQQLAARLVRHPCVRGRCGRSIEARTRRTHGPPTANRRTGIQEAKERKRKHETTVIHQNGLQAVLPSPLLHKQPSIPLFDLLLIQALQMIVVTQAQLESAVDRNLSISQPHLRIGRFETKFDRRPGLLTKGARS
jgi:hypothetical protein